MVDHALPVAERLLAQIARYRLRFDYVDKLLVEPRSLLSGEELAAVPARGVLNFEMDGLFVDVEAAFVDEDAFAAFGVAVDGRLFQVLGISMFDLFGHSRERSVAAVAGIFA